MSVRASAGRSKVLSRSPTVQCLDVTDNILCFPEAEPSMSEPSASQRNILRHELPKLKRVAMYTADVSSTGPVNTLTLRILEANTDAPPKPAGIGGTTELPTRSRATSVAREHQNYLEVSSRSNLAKLGCFKQRGQTPPRCMHAVLPTTGTRTLAAQPRGDDSGAVTLTTISVGQEESQTQPQVMVSHDSASSSGTVSARQLSDADAGCVGDSGCAGTGCGSHAVVRFGLMSSPQPRHGLFDCDSLRPEEAAAAPLLIVSLVPFTRWTARDSLSASQTAFESIDVRADADTNVRHLDHQAADAERAVSDIAQGVHGPYQQFEPRHLVCHSLALPEEYNDYPDA